MVARGDRCLSRTICWRRPHAIAHGVQNTAGIGETAARGIMGKVDRERMKKWNMDPQNRTGIFFLRERSSTCEGYAKGYEKAQRSWSSVGQSARRIKFFEVVDQFEIHPRPLKRICFSLAGGRLNATNSEKRQSYDWPLAQRSDA